MAVTTGPILVDAPRTRERYGIFATSEIDESVDPHVWLGGVQFITGNCGDAVGYTVACASSLAAKTFASEPAFNTATPFIVYAGRLCGTVGFTEAESQRYTLAKLRSAEQTVVEQVFSDQLFGQSPGLANNPSVTTVAVAAGINFVEAVGRLEAAFYAAYGYAGTIHMPFRAGEHASSQHILHSDAEFPLPGNDRVWKTAVGSTVSIGAYSGNSPAGAAPAAGHQWIYITPPVKIWRQSDSQVFVSPIEGSLNRTTNQETWLAERSYVVGFECNEVFAIDATLPTQTTT
jgi:hypothetical protein